MRLQVEKLNFSYGTKKILQDISFDIKDGEFVSILGPSGCGKSTLLKSMRLQVEKLNFSYGTKKILQDISFDIKDGEFVSILGPSGCGKSTLLNVLAGIRKPESGRILVDAGEKWDACGTFAYMPQDDLLFPWRTILDNVCLYGELHHCKDKMKAEAMQKLEQFGLSGCGRSLIMYASMGNFITVKIR